MPSPKRRLGDIGEGVACKYLESGGFLILERNYWKPWGEIDIVASKNGSLHFVEVKSISRGTSGVRPEENMHQGKIKRLHRAIQTYLMDKKVSEKIRWQIDLACVELDLVAKTGKVEYFENAVL